MRNIIGRFVCWFKKQHVIAAHYFNPFESNPPANFEVSCIRCGRHFPWSIVRDYYGLIQFKIDVDNL